GPHGGHHGRVHPVDGPAGLPGGQPGVQELQGRGFARGGLCGAAGGDGGGAGRRPPIGPVVDGAERVALRRTGGADGPVTARPLRLSATTLRTREPVSCSPLKASTSCKKNSAGTSWRSCPS